MMIYCLTADDIPLLSQWIKKSTCFHKSIFWQRDRDSKGSAFRLLRKHRLCSASPRGVRIPITTTQTKKQSTSDDVLCFWQRDRDSKGSAFRLLRKHRLCSASPRGVRIPYTTTQTKKQSTSDDVLCFWQRDRDSNPNKQSQSLSCYRYTIPLGTSDIILSVFPNVNRKIPKI